MGELPNEDVKRGVDLWLFWALQRTEGVKAKIGWIREDGWQRGVDTHGLNNISQRRSGQIANHRPPFWETDAEVGEVLPADVVKRLGEMRVAALERSCYGLVDLADENAAEIAKLRAKLENFRGMLKRWDEEIEKLEARLCHVPKWKLRLFGRGTE